MAIGWATILSNVPWSDVLKNAPAVADGAKKLWQKVGRKGASASTGVDVPADATAEERLARLQARVDELGAQMQASGEIIQSLAEQNAQLIARVETSRRRLLALALFNLVTLAVALAAWLR